MLASVAINETTKCEAFQFIDRGYTQSTKSVECPTCGKRYLLLLDASAYHRDLVTPQPIQITSLAYFAERLRESHKTDHREDQLVMP
jgi:hypothetical protein